MFQFLSLAIGGGLAVIGFFAMRNPMLLARLAPGEEGYYQRQILDRFARNQMRMLGMIASYFGFVILTAGLKGILRFQVLQSISDGFLILLWLSFIATFGFGVIYFIVQLIRGRAIGFIDWFHTRKRQIELGPINVHPAVTTRISKETKIFTLIYGLLIAATLGVSILVQ